MMKLNIIYQIKDQIEHDKKEGTKLNKLDQKRDQNSI